MIEIKRLEGVGTMVRYRNTWAEIDLAAIRHNIVQLKSLLPENRKVMGVVKADGYGHGSVEVAKIAIEHGIDHLMVAYLEEAVKLREAGIEVPILVIGRISPEFVPVAIHYNVTLAIYQVNWIQEVLSNHYEGTLSVHLEFETGFNRTGIRTKEALQQMVHLIKESDDKMNITGAYTHFATADEINSVHYLRQKARYEEMLAELERLYDQPIIAHTGNSAAGIQYPEQMRNYTRFGISLYGLYPSMQIENLGNVQLQQAFSLYSELIEVKHIEPGDYIGYGITYEAEKAEWIGTVPIGYADGWPRALQGFHVLVAGKKQPIVGRICMDMLMIRLDKQYKVGEKVTLIGKDKSEEILVDDVATYLKTINYEIPCMITSRVPREYINQ